MGIFTFLTERDLSQESCYGNSIKGVILFHHFVPFKLLLQMKLFLTHHTKRVLASGLHLPRFYKDMRLASTCVTIIVTDCFDDFVTRSFDISFSYLWFYKA